MLSRRGLLLDPFPAFLSLHNFGLAYFGAQRYNDALEIFNHALERAKKDNLRPYGLNLDLAMTYAMLDQMEQARVHVEEALKINPNLTAKRYFEYYRFKNQVDVDRFINASRKAGLPE